MQGMKTSRTTMVLVAAMSLAGCVPAEEAPLHERLKADDGAGAGVAIQRCQSADRYSYVDSFELHYLVDASGDGTLLSPVVQIAEWQSDYLESENLQKTASFVATQWGVSSSFVTIAMSDTESGELADMQLLLADDYDGERAVGFFKFTSDGPIGTSLIECDEFPFANLGELTSHEAQ